MAITRSTDKPTVAARSVRNTDRPTVALKSEAEVYIVKHALDRLHRRYIKAADELHRRGAIGIEYMMRNRAARIHGVWAVVPETGDEAHLTNKEQVDLASNACESLITELRLGQRVEYDEYVSSMIKVLEPLLDRIRIGWKRPAEIPPEIMEQIKAREGGRFWNATPGDWIELEAPRVDDEDVYTWRSPVFDLVTDFEWIGLQT